MTDLAGQLFGSYRLVRRLGSGGFASVYLGQHLRISSMQAAVKILDLRDVNVQQFQQEAEIMARLVHPNIVRLLDFDVQEDIPFLVLDYAPGGSLRMRHPKGSLVPLATVIAYLKEFVPALQHAHDQHILHRDIKPDNILIGRQGELLLADFSIALLLQAGKTSVQSPANTGGTPYYMAPEQFLGKPEKASDQYALAVVVYEWLCGTVPFSEGGWIELGFQHLQESVPSLRPSVPALPATAEQVVMRALSKRPEARFPTVQDFTAALEETAHGAPALPDGYTVSPINNNRSLFWPERRSLPVSSLGMRPPSGPRVDWGDAPAISPFYGREQEHAQLAQWVLQEDCRVVGVLGMGGIGKSALSFSIVQQLAQHFEVVIFRTLRDAPPLEVLLDDCLQVLSPQLLSPVPDTLEQRISLLLGGLRKVRSLVVLDNLEGLLEPGEIKGHFRPSFEGYGQLLRRFAETEHKSCLLLTSREKPAELRLLESKYSSSVRTLRLAGLEASACQQLLEERELVGTEQDAEQLINAYSGNPLALKIVTETIINLFGSQIGLFLDSGIVIFGSVTDLLEEQFMRLSPLEQSVLCWLAIMREPITLSELSGLLVTEVSHAQILEAVDAGYRRSLIERGKRAGSFTLQSVVLEYVTALLITEGSREIKLRQLDRLIQYGLCQAHSKEYVRQTQVHLLVSPLLAVLQYTYRRQAAIEEQLLGLLDDLRKRNDAAQGYGPANLIALLRLLRGSLSSLDLSRLSIRHAYLQSIEMHNMSLAESLLRDSIFTEAVSATRTVAISPDGRWWAVGCIQGKVRVWQEGSQMLRLIWQAHADAVYSLAFSPDGLTLASGSMDGSVKLWDVGASLAVVSSYGSPGTPLWTAWQKNIQGLAFTPDGSLLASGGDVTVQLWQTRNHAGQSRGSNVQTLTHPSDVYAVAFSPDGQWLVSGCFNGEIRLWERQVATSAPYVEILSVQTSWVTDLTFAPDGRTLTSAHLDLTVRLWEVASLRLLHTLSELRARRIAWSPDGRLLASYRDKAICIFDVEEARIRSVLHGHSADIYRLTFAPDSRLLLSGSADGTLRVWNMENYQCVRVVAGYGFSLYELDWSPDSTRLVCGGSDTLVTVWDVSAEKPPSVLRGHGWIVTGVAWSPDGKLLASCGWDATVRLWDATSHAPVHMFKGQTILLRIAWSPDGSLLACGTYGRGMQVWDVRANGLSWVGQPYQTMFHGIAWSPDGTRLASSSDDGSVYIWESANGTLLQRLPGHHGWVFRVVWSPDGSQLASGSRGQGMGELFVWDVLTGVRLRAFAGLSGQVYAVVWSRSHGRDQLISGDSDGVLRWWDVQSGECVGMQVAHQGAIRSLKVSPDGKFLASCGNDGAIKIWDLGGGKHVRTLRRDRPYEGLNITGVRGLTEAQKTSLKVLGAIEDAVP